MPRYIDADNIDYTVTMVGRDEYAGYRAVAFENDIDAMPTADVVPIAEVERLQYEAESLRNANADLALALLYECEPTKEHLSELEKAVREKVAREIFEEINAIKKEYARGNIDGNELYIHLYRLEKKYTEEQKQ